MALTVDQERAISIALGDSFNADQKKNLLVALNNVQDGGGQVLTAGTGIDILEDIVSLESANQDGIGGVFQGAAVADATDEPSAVTQLNALLVSLRDAQVIAV